MFLCNAFSLGMLESLNVDIAVRPVEAQDVRDFHEREGLISAVGHENTAVLFGGLLGFEVGCNRASLSLKPGDRLIVGQYRGPRLPEGATELPEGATVEWALVVIHQEQVIQFIF